MTKLLVLLASLASSTLFAQTSYEAESSANLLHGQAAVYNCSGCSGGKQVNYVGNGSNNSLTINGVQASQGGVATVAISYLVSGTRTLFVSVNGGPSTSYTLSGNSWQTPAILSIGVTLNAGLNNILFFNNSAWAPGIDRIVVTPGSAFGLLSNGLRDKTQWPFDSSSVWNTSIGSLATYQPAGILQISTGGSPTTFGEDGDVVVMTPTAKLTNIYYSGVGWTGGNRCPAQGALLASVPMPANFTIPNGGSNNSAAFLMPDGHTIAQNQPFTRCTSGGDATTFVTCNSVDIYGTDPTGCHGGSGLSDLGGTIRFGEFTAGQIQHAMKVDLWAVNYFYCCTYHWPAKQVDGYASPTTYGGTNPNFGPGTLLALLPSFNVNSLTTIPGRILAQTFRDYGAYVVDDTYTNAWAIAAAQGPVGAVWTEFSKLYGFSMTPAPSDPFMSDMVAIFQSLQIVTNNSPTTIGGGGTPRVPGPPAIGN